MNRASQRIQNIIHINIHTIAHTITFPRIPSDIKPFIGGKVDALRTIVPEIIAGVIAKGESDDEFSLVMDETIYLDTLCFEGGRRGEKGFMSHELGTAFVVVGEVGAHEGFEFFGIALADGIPLFRGPEVNIIDRI